MRGATGGEPAILELQILGTPVKDTRGGRPIWPLALGAVVAAAVAFLALQHVVVGCAFEGLVGLGGGCDLSAGQVTVLALGVGAAAAAVAGAVVAVRRTVARRRCRVADDERPRLWPGLAGLATAVAVGSVVLWLSRAHALRTGLPCEARGWMGCAVDGPLYLAVGLLVGGVVVVGTALAGVVLRRSDARAVRLVTGIGALVWAVLFVLLLIGTRG